MREDIQTMMSESIETMTKNIPFFSTKENKYKFIVSPETRNRYDLKKINTFQGIEIFSDPSCEEGKMYLIDMNNYMIEIPLTISTKILLKLLWLKIKQLIIRR